MNDDRHSDIGSKESKADRLKRACPLPPDHPGDHIQRVIDAERGDDLGGYRPIVLAAIILLILAFWIWAISYLISNIADMLGAF